jgi:hypothetical protein
VNAAGRIRPAVLRIEMVRKPILKKFVLTLTALGVFTLSAASRSYSVSLLQDSIVDGKQLKAGDYKLQMKDSNTAVLKHGKETVEVPAHEETAPQKFATTELTYTNNNDLQEVRIGSTTTKIVFTSGSGSAGGSE